MTIRELFGEFVLYADRLKGRRNRDMSLAWHIAALMRQEKLPKLDRLLVAQGPRKRQTPEDHRKALQMIFGPNREREVLH